MVQLTAKGSNPYVDLRLPVNVAKAQSHVVMVSLRDAVDNIVRLAGDGTPTQDVVAQLVEVRQIVTDVASEAEELATAIHLVEKRMMEL